MVHYAGVQGGVPYLEEAHAAARAARDVGLRIGFAAALRDRHGIGLGDDATVLAALRPGIRSAVAQRLSTPVPPAARQVALVEELAGVLAQDASLAAHADPQYGPTGAQWCGTPLLAAVSRASHDSGRRVHMPAGNPLPA
jgi:5-methylthioadenosine/S-adenosylhomocysteine deaminase